MFDKLVNGMERAIRNLSEVFAVPVHSYCRLETVDNGVLVADDGSLVSIIKLEGSLKHVGVEEYNHIVSGLTEKLQSTLAKPGHALQVMFEYDPEGSSRRIRELLQPSSLTANNLGLHIGDLLNDWGNALQRYCSLESCWIVLWTRPTVLSDTLKKTAMKERGTAMSKVPNLNGCQQVACAVTALHDAHNGFFTGVLDAFKQVDLIAYPLDAHEALREVRMCIAPEYTSRNWEAVVPGDKLPIRLPDPDTSKTEELHNTIYPDFRTQLWPTEGQLMSRTAIRIGERIYGPMIMTLMPQTPKPYQDFFRIMARRDEKLPYRISFLLEDGGLAMGLKPFLSSILAFTSSDNKRFNNAVETLRQMDLEGVCCIKYRICLCTWATVEDNEHIAHLLLRRRVAELAKAVQGWGTCDVAEAIGDPLIGVTATLPAMMPTSPAPVSAAPLPDAISMLPMRPASPWKEGNLLFRTQDGKIMPFAPNSSEQAAWIDLGVAPMGGGKSVFLNAMNFAFVTQAGMSRLPWLSIVDVGPSSSGLITLLKENLPEGKKHLAAYHRLRMTEEYSINPFDLPLGNRRPLPSQRAFLVNFVSLLATPIREKSPGDGVAELVGRAIDLAYLVLSDVEKNNKARLYHEGTQPDLHQLLVRENVPLDSHTKWWEVVDMLFERGFIHEAIQAQRYAVPTLDDVVSQVTQNPGIINTYDPALRAKVYQALIDATNSYVILKNPTKFDLGDAQIVSLDLDEVAQRGGDTADRQSAIMYMLARHVLGSRFFLMPDDVKLMPTLYQAYHAERIEAIREDPKRICYDEAHRVTGNTSVAGQLLADMTTMARESRKWNLSIGLYTQSADDIPPIIINELATTVVILGSGSQKSIDDLTQRFGLNGACSDALARLGKPGKAGSNLVAQFRTGAGTSQLVLSLTIGAQSLWAFSTTTEDVAIRNRLYKRLGPSEALRRLAKRYPGGSAKAEVERRRRLVTDQTAADEEITNVIYDIADEIAEES